MRKFGPKKATSALGERLCPGRLGGHGLAQELRVEHLLRVIPFIERLALVEPLVALKADFWPTEREGARACQIGLAHAGRPFQEDRALEAKREPQDEYGLRVCQIRGARECLLEILAGEGRSLHHVHFSS
jgi:hypothetical protein